MALKTTGGEVPSIMSRLPISCFIIAQNEADRIARTIQSVKSWVDEVVVVDSGSTDDTVAVAQNAHARVISQSWLGFGGQKRFAEEQCRHEWVLNLDADEVCLPRIAENNYGTFPFWHPRACGLWHANPCDLSKTD